jgi:hypothetical protein
VVSEGKALLQMQQFQSEQVPVGVGLKGPGRTNRRSV